MKKGIEFSQLRVGQTCYDANWGYGRITKRRITHVYANGMGYRFIEEGRDNQRESTCAMGDGSVFTPYSIMHGLFETERDAKLFIKSQLQKQIDSLGV